MEHANRTWIATVIHAISIRWRRALISLGLTVLCLYAPFSWILLIDSPWDSYRFFCLKLCPILPGFAPSVLAFHPLGIVEFPAMGITTVFLIAGLTRLGMCGRWGLVGAALLGPLVSVPSAFMSYGVFCE